VTLSISTSTLYAVTNNFLNAALPRVAGPWVTRLLSRLPSEWVDHPILNPKKNSFLGGLVAIMNLIQAEDMTPARLDDYLVPFVLDSFPVGTWFFTTANQEDTEWRSQASILECCRKTSLWLQDQSLPARIWCTKYPWLCPQINASSYKFISIGQHGLILEKNRICSIYMEDHVDAKQPHV
jgi:hypothetical protein